MIKQRGRPTNPNSDPAELECKVRAVWGCQPLAVILTAEHYVYIAQRIQQSMPNKKRRNNAGVHGDSDG